MNAMTGLQRCQAVLAGEVADRVPVVPQTFLFAAVAKYGAIAESCKCDKHYWEQIL